MESYLSGFLHYVVPSNRHNPGSSILRQYRTSPSECAAGYRISVPDIACCTRSRITYRSTGHRISSA
eukprot:1696863-Rhodomonas_salina.3